MIRLTIYRIGSTLEIESENPSLANLKSGEVVLFDPTHYAKGEAEKPILKIRPYYRRTIDGVLNIFAEEEV